MKAGFIECHHIRKCALLPVILFMTVLNSTGQRVDAANLIKKLQAAKQDTDRVNIYYSFSRLYWNRNTDSAILMAQKSLDLAQKIHFEKGIALAYLSKGVALVSAAKYAEALHCHFQSLHLSEKLGLTGLSGNTYNNIGIVYSDMGNYTKAIYYFKEALTVAMLYKGETGYSTSALLINIGDFYKKTYQYDSSIAYTERGLAINRKVHDSLGMAIALFNISETYIKEKMFEKALPYLKESWLISRRIKDTEGMAYSNNNYGLILHHLGDYAASIRYAKTGLMQSEDLGINEVKKSSYNLLYLNYLKLKDYQKALQYRNAETALGDSLRMGESEKAIKNVAVDYELNKKQSQIDLLQKDKEIKQKELNSTKVRRRILTIGILLLGAIVFFLYRGYRDKKSLNRQLKKQNHDILAQNRQLEELNNVKNKLFSIVSHDLRGPIGAVRSMMELMQSDMLSEEESKMLIPKLSDSMLHTSHLLDNMLYWAKSQMNGIQVNAKHFDVLRIIHQNIKLIQGRANQKRVSVQTQKTTEVLWVFGDEAMTDIVVRNLLENAVKFSRPGETITVYTKNDNAFATVCVSDNGKGILLEHQEKIFNKYETHTTYGTGNEKGSGLGLLLCKELVENNKGKIWFESKPEEGSTFSFTVPLFKTVNEPKEVPAYIC